MTNRVLRTSLVTKAGLLAVCVAVAAPITLAVPASAAAAKHGKKAPHAKKKGKKKGTKRAHPVAKSAAHAAVFSLRTPTLGAAVTPPTITTAAELVITSSPAEFVKTRNWSVSFAGPYGNTFQCSLDGGAFTACTSPKTGTGLADGSHTLSVVAVGGGSIGSTAASVTWTVDTVKPAQPTLIGTPPDLTNNRTANVSFTGEPNATFQCSIDGGSFADCTSPQTRGELMDGSYSLSVRQTDRAGNTSVLATALWTVDTIAPLEPTIDSGPPSPAGGVAGQISFHGAEAGGTFTCELDGEYYDPCESPFNFTSLESGDHEFIVYQTDGAGNDSLASRYTWTVDATPPVAPDLTTKPSDPSNDTTPTVDFVPESNTTYFCTVDGGIAEVCTAPVTLPELGEGSHTLVIYGRDDLNNVGPSTTYTWTVDLTAPDAPLVMNVPASGTKDTNASLDIAGEAGATYECNVNDEGWVPCSSPLGLSGLEDGLQTVLVRQTDAAGNTSEAAQVSWVIGDLPPDPPAGEVGLYLSGPGSKTVSGTLWFRNADPVVNTIWPAGAKTVTLSNSPVFSRYSTYPVGQSVNWHVNVAVPASTGTRPIYAKFSGDSRVNRNQVYQVNFNWDRVVPYLKLAARKKSLGFSADNWNVRLAGGDQGSGLRTAQFWMKRNGLPTFQQLSIGPGFVRLVDIVIKVPGGFAPVWVRAKDQVGNWSQWYLVR